MPKDDTMWRRFEPHVEALAAKCARDLWSEEPFTPTGNAGGGGSSAVQVRMNDSGLPAWAKPARISADSGIHVANEKIAADIAHELGLPVAPVILSKQTAGLTLPAGAALPPIVALSFEALAQPRPWNELAPLLSVEQKNEIKTIATIMRAFHALICDSDHGGIGANALFESTADGTIRTSYFDHSNSLIRGGWQPPAPAPVGVWAAWPGDFANPDRALVDAILSRIEQLAPDAIKRIIGQIPDECLPPPNRDALLIGFNDRRGQLRGILNP